MESSSRVNTLPTTCWMKPKQQTPSAPAQSAGDPDESFTKRLVEGSQDCIKVLDLDGRLLAMNAGGMKVLEICDLAPLIGSSWIDFWKGADRAAAQNAVKAARDGGIGRFVGFFPTTQTRTPMWFDVLVSPVLDADGQ